VLVFLEEVKVGLSNNIGNTWRRDPNQEFVRRCFLLFPWDGYRNCARSPLARYGLTPASDAVVTWEGRRLGSGKRRKNGLLLIV
jgi:hypothetical protein